MHQTAAFHMQNSQFFPQILFGIWHPSPDFSRWMGEGPLPTPNPSAFLVSPFSLAFGPSGELCHLIIPILNTDCMCLCSRPHTLHGGGNSRSLPSTVTVMPGDVNSPYHKQFVHSKSQQYRRLKTEWRNNVYLRRSNVQVRVDCGTAILFHYSSQLRLKSL